MGQKVNPVGFRIGVYKEWDSLWCAQGSKYADYLHEDLKIRNYIKKELAQAGISKVGIKRAANKAQIEIHTARPGVVIGKKGSDIEKVKSNIAKFTNSEISLNIVEVRKPELDAALAAQSVALQLEKRVSFRKAMKKVIQTAMKMGALGIKVAVSGRLGGAEIARTEWYREGRVPLHTLRADIDYATAEAHTTYGVIGVKVWIYRPGVIN
ncbi:MAG: 30S ribosomal protein S3 [Alphaproteobacteria bacterium]|nr:30S ribosomal protein S3 [Alphaproteobacteria bacterium]OJV16380.1 MAG: 30S ribosomal protein S3 [Alphaproteobacteria bacterium 33-17]